MQVQYNGQYATLPRLRRGFDSLHLLQSSSWMNREGKQQVLRGSLEKTTGITALSSLCGGFDLYSKRWEASAHINYIWWGQFSWLERQIVALEVASSTLVPHPNPNSSDGQSTGLLNPVSGVRLPFGVPVNIIKKVKTSGLSCFCQNYGRCKEIKPSCNRARFYNLYQL